MEMNAQKILILFLSLFSVRLIWEQMLLVLNLKHAHIKQENPPPVALEIWGAAAYGKAVAYSRNKITMTLISSLFDSAFLLVMILSGWLGTLELLISNLTVGTTLQGILYVYSISLLFSVASLPATIYSQFVIEQRYGFNRMNWKTFILDGLKSAAVTLTIVTPLLFVLFTLIRAGSLWWLWGFLLFALFQLVMLVLYPKIIAPLFNRFTPLQEGALKDQIRELANRLGFKTSGIFVMDGSRRSGHSNAHFTGLGRTKRIVLYDTLIRSLENDQVAGVLAHEVGHQRHRHILKRLAVSIPSALLVFWILSRLLTYPPFFVAFGFRGPSLQAALVLLVFVSGSFTFIFKPLFSWWSRRQEYRADRFVQRHTSYAAALQGALKRLSRDNLSNPVPHPLFSFYHYSHPTPLERIRALSNTVFDPHSAARLD